MLVVVEIPIGTGASVETHLLNGAYNYLEEGTDALMRPTREDVGKVGANAECIQPFNAREQASFERGYTPASSRNQTRKRAINGNTG